MVRLQIIFISFLFFFNSVFSQDRPLLISNVDTTNIKIGEQINYEFKIEFDQELNVEWRDSILQKPFEIIKKFKRDTLKSNKKLTLTKRYAITSFDSGEYYLVSPKIFINQIKYQSDSILISVANVKVDTVSKKFFDIKKIIEVEENITGWWKKYLAILLIIILIYVLYIVLKTFLHFVIV